MQRPGGRKRREFQLGKTETGSWPRVGPPSGRRRKLVEDRKRGDITLAGIPIFLGKSQQCLPEIVTSHRFAEIGVQGFLHFWVHCLLLWIPKRLHRLSY